MKNRTDWKWKAKEIGAWIIALPFLAISYVCSGILLAIGYCLSAIRRK